MINKHILSGCRVLDFTHALAGPTTTRLMAEMGADVVKVELAPHGDMVRAMPFFKDGRSAYFVQQNRGKKSLCLDIRKPEALELLKKLIGQSDVLLENYTPGVIADMGLSWEVAREINPQLIYCSISAFGQSGPLSGLPGFDYMGQAYSGVTSLMGEPDEAPVMPTISMGDVNTGVHALAAINGALYYRSQGGGGQYIDCSLLDSYFHCHDLNVQLCSNTKGAVQPTRNGRHHPAVAPDGIFRGRDSCMFIIALTPKQWEALCGVMGRTELIGDPRYKTFSDRAAHLDEIIEIIEGWLQSMPSDDASRAALEAAHVPVAPVLTPGEAMQHPHLVERVTVRTVHDRVLGDFKIPGMPLRFSEFPEPLGLEAPFLGEHNATVLGDMLAMSAGEIEQLKASGVLHAESIADPG
ncbi:MAG TPA: formyl-CoA transferase [Porticoccaceae bacterium]|nr:formyl-CoA transferase [Porticoccaceae bacterium]